MIHFERASIRYPGASHDAVSAVSFDAQRGAITAVVGPNGSGKSTLVRALVRRVPLGMGAIRIDQIPVSEMPRQEFARRVAVIPQREELTFPTAVADYVALGRFPHLGIWHAAKAVDREALEHAMRQTGVSDLRGRRTDTLSGGEWQRVRLARGLAQGGGGIVLDEPTSSLDIGHEMAVFELLSGLADDGQAVLLVSHQLNLVARFADRIVLLHGGRLIADGPPSEVMQASVLEHVYEWPLIVTHDPAVGAPALVPLRAPRTPSK